MKGRIRDLINEVEYADYGYVAIIGGVHKGEIGYYDDEDSGSDKCIVYLGEPCLGSYVSVKRKYLVRIEQQEITK